MGNQPYLLFDAGGTIVFPDQDFLIREAHKWGIKLTHDQLYEGYYRLIYCLDSQARSCKKHKLPPPWPDGYAHDLFETLGILDQDTEIVADAFWDHHLNKENLWAFTFEWVRETLSLLHRQGYRMSVLSNSDGRTDNVMCRTGLRPYFEQIFDSVELGIEKPNPKIFEKILNELELQPKDVLYIGDIYYIDILGANQAGLGAIHIDPFDLYKDLPGIHVKDISELPQWLAYYTGHTPPSNSSFNHESASDVPAVSPILISVQLTNQESLIPLANALP